MIEYITVTEVDTLLGSEWAEAEQKERAVMIANVWMTNQSLPDLDPVPDEWSVAGSEVAKDAAAGKLFGAKETGVVSKSVSAGDVSSSKTFSTNAKTYTAGESLALAILKPWLPSRRVFMLERT